MNIYLFCHDTYYCTTPDRKYFSQGAFPYSLWRERFLPHCNELIILGRDGAPLKAKQNMQLPLSSGPNTQHILLPNVNTPIKRLQNIIKTKKHILELVTQASHIIIRGPSEFGMIAAHYARKQGKPYAVEMSGCAFDHTWHHGHWAGKLYAPIKYMRARKMVCHATQTIYVTEHFLQKRYPCKGSVSNASNVEIEIVPVEALKRRITKIKNPARLLKIGMIANYGNKLKGLHIAIKALASANKDLPPWELHILGQGNPQQWNKLIKQYALEDKIIFHPPIPGGQTVLDWLDDKDIYIQPSLHEGLPRAVIEAMSRGLPCLASNTGGTPELLSPQAIHKKGDYKLLRNQLVALVNNKHLQEQQAQENFKTAQNYSSTKLSKKRAAFWKRFSKQP